MGAQLAILTRKEIYQIYGLPKFKKKQRSIYLEMSLPEQELVRKYRQPITRIYFMLQLAYFKFKQQFFVFDISEVAKDVAYLQEAYSIEQDIPTKGTISKPSRLAQQRVILQLMGYRIADKEIRQLLFDRASHVATLSASPTFLFRDLINWTEQQRVVLPGYSIMQRSIIGKALTLERKRLEGILKVHLSKNHQQQMDNLISEKIGHYYGLTWLQQEAPNFKPRSIREETKRKETLQPLFETSKSILEKFAISNENINYYASLANHYTVGELRQFIGGIQYIYLLSYIQYRYQQINDVLTQAFIYYVRKYETEAKQIVKEFFYKYHVDANKQLGKIPEILKLFVDDTIADDTPFVTVKKQVLDILDREKILLLTDFINDKHINETELRWQHYEEIKQQVSYNLRHLFLYMEFTAEQHHKTDPLMKACSFLKSNFSKGKSLKRINPDLVPKDFIPKYLQIYVFTEDGFIPSRYELMLYQSLRRQIEAGHVFIKDSATHQSLESDLIPLNYWRENKDQILAKVNLKKLLMRPQDLLAQLKKELEQKIKQVNQAITKEENKEVTVTKKSDGTTKWKLIYTAKEEQPNHKLYEQFPVIGIIPLLKWVNDKTDFLSLFKHILEKGTTKEADPIALIASIIALGTNNGVGSIASRSAMDYNKLKRTVHNFIRKETLQEANRIIVDACADLPIFDHYNLTEDNTIHSSSDGQKYPTRFDTINARHSSKYFGLSKGISAGTLVGNNLPVNIKIFGSNDHESHYVFDLLYNNPTKVQSKIHSTDTHGTNKVNFAILDIFGYQFAPRYKQFSKEMAKLVGFKSLSSYPKKYLIKPCRKVNEKLFVNQFDTFQRIIASLALQTTTQSTIVKKLSSFLRVNEPHQAFIEYNDIIKSIFMLDYVHLKNFKQNIQTALNRGEGYHRLRKNISYAHDGKFQVKTQAEQLVWSECTRLIANAIIYYNSFLLSQLLEFHTKAGNEKEVELLKSISPIAWQHINLYGLYNFLQAGISINWQEIIKNIRISRQ